MATFTVPNAWTGNSPGFGAFNSPSNIPESFYTSIMPVPITIVGLSISTPLTIGQSATVSMVNNGFNIPPTLTITSPTTHASITSPTKFYPAGQGIAQSITAPSAPGSPPVNIATAYQPSPPYQNLCLLPSFTSPTLISVDSTPPTLLSIDGQYGTLPTSMQAIWPANGAFQIWTVRYSIPFGTTGIALSLFKNYTQVWILTLPPTSGAVSTVTDMTTIVPVAAGDIIYYEMSALSGLQTTVYISLRQFTMGFRSS